MTKIVYLAGPIDKVPTENLSNLDEHRASILANARGTVTTWLVERDWSIYNPLGAWAVAGSRDGRIKAINDLALGVCDRLLVLLPDGIPTWGVPAEIERATMLGIPVTVVSDTAAEDLTWSQHYADRTDHATVAWYVVPKEPAETWIDQLRLWLQTIQSALDDFAGVPEAQRGTTESLETPAGYPEGDEDVSGAPEGTEVPPMVHTGVEADDYTLARQRLGELEAALDETTQNLPIQVRHPDAQMPTRAYDDDAGLDLYVVGKWTIQPGQTVDVPHQVAVELPNWSWGFLLGRSSTLRVKGLIVNPAVIDAGWRGQLFTSVHNPGSTPVTINHGDRVSQFVILENSTRRVVPVLASDLRPSDRGESGFGSSGH